jgi:hypothetical protein
MGPRAGDEIEKDEIADSNCEIVDPESFAGID